MEASATLRRLLSVGLVTSRCVPCARAVEFERMLPWAAPTPFAAGVTPLLLVADVAGSLRGVGMLMEVVGTGDEEGTGDDAPGVTSLCTTCLGVIACGCGVVAVMLIMLMAAVGTAGIGPRTECEVGTGSATVATNWPPTIWALATALLPALISRTTGRGDRITACGTWSSRGEGTNGVDGATRRCSCTTAVVFSGEQAPSRTVATVTATLERGSRVVLGAWRLGDRRSRTARASVLRGVAGVPCVTTCRYSRLLGVPCGAA
mmetsp:Transcript_95025/g.245494  ORF Transcript_95025/g.245494 Transcript_95025/m.245494 type:complete len:262 (-) Transcript_95025:570-1355(-)